ncbi:hypothetical protein GGR95_002971 [Sulfitobacter undariae]|uniref:LydA family holin superfamily III n=1 Tax=Sulfitobacter undariae TaxID=1563671 RepID=A0A7W6E5U7_9RHOB|nr:hypothetical protein [Sulfitobacter undariae]MBB3995316.1 hypothetical protein [Sulfitobacter undariae]
MSTLETIRQVIGAAPEQLTALCLSGAAGAYVRAVFAPQASWRRRMSEGFAGALSAIFLGGLVGHLIHSLTDAGTWAFLAAGFVMGEGGIAAVRGVRKLILKEQPK